MQIEDLILSFDPNEQRDPSTGRWISGKTAIAGGAGVYIGHKLARKKRLKTLRRLRKSKQIDSNLKKLSTKGGSAAKRILKKGLSSKYGKKTFRKLSKKFPDAAEKLVGYLMKK